MADGKENKYAFPIYKEPQPATSEEELSYKQQAKRLSRIKSV